MTLESKEPPRGAAHGEALALPVSGGSLSRDLTTILADWQATLSPSSWRAYSGDLRHAAQHFDLEGAAELARALTVTPRATAELGAMRWRAAMEREGLAPATVARRLSALRALVKVLRRLGFVDWHLETPGPAIEAKKDNSGPSLASVRVLWAYLGAQKGPRGARNRAIFRLFWDLGLRVGEIAALDCEDLDLSNSKIAVVGKGRRLPSSRSLPPETLGAIRSWLAVRPPPDNGSLFVALQPPHTGHRLTARAIRDWIANLGESALGCHLRPHGLRHAGITASLDAGAGLREVAAWARHRNPATTADYDDRRQDAAGGVARLNAALLGGHGGAE